MGIAKAERQGLQVVERALSYVLDRSVHNFVIKNIHKPVYNAGNDHYNHGTGEDFGNPAKVHIAL